MQSLLVTLTARPRRSQTGKRVMVRIGVGKGIRTSGTKTRIGTIERMATLIRTAGTEVMSTVSTMRTDKNAIGKLLSKAEMMKGKKDRGAVTPKTGLLRAREGMMQKARG
jgi:hypothetical protein